MNILILTKRQYMKKDLLDDRYGRFREIPLALAQRGHSVNGLCLSYIKREEGQISDGLVCWKSINASRLKAPGLMKFFREACNLAKHADVIWACSDSIYGIMGYGLSRQYGVPLVFDLYDNFEFFFMARLPVVKQLYRYVVKNCDAMTCVSRPLARLVSAYGRKKQPVILENAVRTDLFFPMNKEKCRQSLGLPQKVKLIGTAGALTRNRGIQIIFEAFNLIANKYQDLHLAVAGPRDFKMPCKARIHDCGILPFEKVPIFLNALDVGIVCNMKNDFGKYCFPQKTREIMACNIPIVAANVGSMEELFKNHPEWLYEPGNVQALIRTLENRFHNKTTHYAPLPSWSDLAEILEKILVQLQNEK